MKTKTLFSMLLLTFVIVSIVFAFRKVAPETTANQEQAANSIETSTATTPAGLNAKLADSQFSAVYFHAPHRCPTCRKIESFSYKALTPEIEAGKLAWQIADYTSDDNASLVAQFEVFTSTVVLVEVQAGKVIRWKNLEEVWNHTSDQADFTAFIIQALSEFKAS
ncbi:MAG: nitrophenyl compound nitroreductase subunit ArsF family protein [Planctomycetota bacterium]